MKRVALVVSLALVAAPAIASAQIGFGAFAGASVPMSDLSNNYSTGYHAQLSLNISPPLSPLGFRIDGTLDNFALKSSGSGATTSGSYRVAGVGGNVVLGLGAVPLIGPYVLAGAGFYNVNASTTVGTTTSSGSSNKPGANIGAGVRFGLGTLGASAEIGYHFISTSGSSAQFVPVMFGISF